MKYWNVQRYNDEDLYELILGSSTLCEDTPVPVYNWQSLAAEAAPNWRTFRDNSKLKPISRLKSTL
jgi:hypothetical protein